MKNIIIVICLLIGSAACKKQQSAPITTASNPAFIAIGDYVEYGSDITIRDTVHVYTANGYFYMTCADMNANTNGDTIQIVPYSDYEFTIPKQMVYGNQYYNDGSGYMVNNKLYITFTSPTYTKSPVFNKL